MSDPSLPADDPAPSSYAPYDRPPCQALDEMPAEVRAAWRNRYLAEAEAELRVQALLDRAEAALRSAGTPPTIRTLRISLANPAQTLRVSQRPGGQAMPTCVPLLPWPAWQWNCGQPEGHSEWA